MIKYAPISDPRERHPIKSATRLEEFPRIDINAMGSFWDEIEHIGRQRFRCILPVPFFTESGEPVHVADLR